MLENSPNQAHATVVVKAYASYGSCIGMWLNGLKRSPHGPFADMHKHLWAHTVYHTKTYKRASWSNCLSLTESRPF